MGHQRYRSTSRERTHRPIAIDLVYLDHVPNDATPSSCQMQATAPGSRSRGRAFIQLVTPVPGNGSFMPPPGAEVTG